MSIWFDTVYDSEYGLLPGVVVRLVNGQFCPWNYGQVHHHVETSEVIEDVWFRLTNPISLNWLIIQWRRLFDGERQPDQCVHQLQATGHWFLEVAERICLVVWGLESWAGIWFYWCVSVFIFKLSYLQIWKKKRKGKQMGSGLFAGLIFSETN